MVKIGKVMKVCLKLAGVRIKFVVVMYSEILRGWTFKLPSIVIMTSLRNWNSSLNFQICLSFLTCFILLELKNFPTNYIFFKTWFPNFLLFPDITWKLVTCHEWSRVIVTASLLISKLLFEQCDKVWKCWKMWDLWPATSCCLPPWYSAYIFYRLCI